MRFSHLSWFWVTHFKGPDLSLGIHVCMRGRLDFHFLFWMFSFGRVPIYVDRQGKKFAVSNSYHETKKGPLRAGVP